jgi:hypothetical protein
MTIRNLLLLIILISLIVLAVYNYNAGRNLIFGLAAFLFLIGVYSSAISVSQDRNIRKYIKNYAKQLTLLGGIGSAEMEKEIQKIVKNVMTEVEVKAQTLENTTGIESSLQEKELKEYVKIAIQEARSKQTESK